MTFSSFTLFFPFSITLVSLGLTLPLHLSLSPPSCTPFSLSPSPPPPPLPGLSKQFGDVLDLKAETWAHLLLIEYAWLDLPGAVSDERMLMLVLS